MTVSMRSTHPCLSYILIQLPFIRCLTRAPGQRFLKLFTTSPWKFPWSLRPRKVNTSSALKHTDAVLEQLWIQVLESGAVLEQNIRGEFGLVGNPIMMHAFEQVSQQRIDPAGERFEQAGEVFLVGEMIGKTLGARAIVDVHKGVFDLRVADAVLRHLAGQPFVAVDVDLDRERKPGLDAHVHETELAVDVVEIHAQTTRRTRGQTWFALPVLQLETMAGLNAREDANQSFRDPVALCDLPRPFFLAHRRVEINIRPPRPAGNFLGVIRDAVRTQRREVFEILEQDPTPVEKPLHAFRITDRQIPLEHHPVEARNHSRNLIPMLYNKPFQGVSLPQVSFTNPCILEGDAFLN